MKMFRLAAFAVALFCLTVCNSVAAKTELKPGDAAPDFSLTANDGKIYALKDLAGKKVVLYFYPKDETPGCTKEACAFRDRNKEIQDQGAMVFGINTDSLASHHRFAKKYNLTFPLLTDPGAKTAKAYGAMGIGWVKRQTFVIDTHGKIAFIFRDVQVDRHSEEVVKALQTTP